MLSIPRRSELGHVGDSMIAGGRSDGQGQLFRRGGQIPKPFPVCGGKNQDSVTRQAD